MKKIIFGLLFILSAHPIYAEQLSLDQLLQNVRTSQSTEAKTNRNRESQFIAEKNKQQHLLQSTLSTLSKQESLSAELKQKLDENEQQLSHLENQLNDKSGVLGELFGVARQVAGDLKADISHSLISAQYTGRSKQLDALINNKALPTIKQLEDLWYTLQQEMTESGKVVFFNTQIEHASGKPYEAKVIRIGTFNALANGEYLQFSPETERLTQLARQPESKYLSLAEDLFETQNGPVTAGVDPTRGVILSMLIQAPDTVERIQQGGFIGYIILIMGGIGGVYAIIRLITLTQTSQRVSKQIGSDSASSDNPLGRVFIAADQDNSADVENLELILDEAITREVPILEKGLPMIKLLAAVAPLLGLLGTVTGMIATFQSISLFGTGDPKLMASGISQALVTTMLGLCVAIPLLFLHSLVASRSRVLIQILDEQSAGLISQRRIKK